MAEIYYDLVVSGQKTLDQIPSKWRAEVERLIEEHHPFGEVEEPTTTVTDDKIAHRI